MRIQENATVGKLSQSAKASLLHKLKTGDVLQGMVKQIYPNHRAAIQMQGNQLVAQLEASLSVGGRYFFQVTSNEGKVPELKVMPGTQNQQNGGQMIANLLQQLGIKESKLSSQLISALIREQIPLQKAGLMQAIQYIQENKISSQQAQPIIMQLMKSRLPITDATFQAIQAFQKGNISDSLQTLERSLLPNQQPMLRMNLERVLKGFSSEESAVRAALAADAQQEKPTLLPLLQKLGFVSKAIDKQAWTTILQQWNSSTSQNQGTTNSPFTISFGELKEQVQSILANQNQMMTETKNYQALERLMNIMTGSNERAVQMILTADAQQEKPTLFPLLQDFGFVSKGMDKQAWTNALQQWNPSSSQKQGVSTPPFTTNFEGVKEQIQSILANQKQLMAEAKALQGGGAAQANSSAVQSKPNLEVHFPQYFSNNVQSEAARQLIEALTESKNYQALERLVNIWSSSNENVINNPKEQFLQQLNWVMHDAGLHAGSALKTDEANAVQLKRLLLEMIQNSSGGIAKDNAQQVVHFLNGMQLNNINDNNYFIQANIQIPSQKLGLSKDIDLHFEGKKTNDGKIDPEYCRIIFDLQLHRMKETIIDLHVQKNALTITIYNDLATTPRIVDKFRPNLQAALEKMNFQLTSIICKPYTELDKQQVQKTINESSNHGKVDFRV